jgi:hypothetical protein
MALSDFQDPTKFQTEEDRAIIRKLIEEYITDKRTIILLVSPSLTMQR